jgi:3-hydroxypropanoate dehydrogenase
MTAPVTAIIAWDTEFHEHLPKLFPQADICSYFVGNKPLIEENASATVLPIAMLPRKTTR